MWCTAPLYHAAGRQIYQVAADDAADDFVALNPLQAKQTGIADRKVDVFRFEAVRVAVADTARVPTVKPADPMAGQLTAGFLGMDEDRVGTHRLLPDGLNDCRVQLRGLTLGVAIQNVIVTGPRDGRWEQIETGRWWRVASQRDGEQLDIYFHFWAAGTHRATIVYEDKTTQAVAFEIPIPSPAVLHTETASAEPNLQIFRQVHPRFGAIMEKCLKNTLADLVP